jgi:hypothetical protein
MRKEAFTLFEMLIVIFVFWTGILTVLNVLTHSLAYFDTISTKTKADFLAKEAIEIAYNFRDSRIEEWLPWNYLTWDTTEEYIWTWENLIFKIGFSTGSNPYWIFEPASITNSEWNPMSFDEIFKNFALDIYTWDTVNNIAYYVYTGLLDVLPWKWFARYVEFSPIYESWTDSRKLNENKILKIASHALYKRGSLTWEVVLESFIGMKDSTPAER